MTPGRGRSQRKIGRHAGRSDATITGVDIRPLTRRERDVLDALLAVEIPGSEALRSQARDVLVAGLCGCGCPSIDFQADFGLGMQVRVNAAVRGSDDGLFLFTIVDARRGELLGGIEWTGAGSECPAELPSPDLLDIRPA